MSEATLFSALGVGLILVGFLGSSFNKISQTSLVYWLLNLAGGILATVGAVMIGSVPFVVMEVVWTVASLVGLGKWVVNYPRNQ